MEILGKTLAGQCFMKSCFLKNNYGLGQGVGPV